jgi:hypothetical protein
MDAFLNNILAVADVNHHISNSICRSLLDRENDTKNVMSQQPLLDDKVALMKSTTPQQVSVEFYHEI